MIDIGKHEKKMYTFLKKANTDSIVGLLPSRIPKEYVAVSIDICPWQNSMRLGIKLKVTPCDIALDKEEINTNTRNCTMVLI